MKRSILVMAAFLCLFGIAGYGLGTGWIRVGLPAMAPARPSTTAMRRAPGDAASDRLSGSSAAREAEPSRLDTSVIKALRPPDVAPPVKPKNISAIDLSLTDTDGKVKYEPGKPIDHDGPALAVVVSDNNIKVNSEVARLYLSC